MMSLQESNDLKFRLFFVIRALVLGQNSVILQDVNVESSDSEMSKSGIEPATLNINVAVPLIMGLKHD